MGNINSLEDLVLFVRRFWLLVAAITIVGTVATVWHALQQPHVWEAAAVVRVETPSITTEERGVTDVRLSSARLQQIEQDLLSRDAAIDMIRRYQLFEDLPALSLAEKILLVRTSVQFMPVRPEGIPFGPEQPITSIVIFSQQGDPDTAAAIANELAERMVNLSSERQNETVRQAQEFFSREEARIGTDIAALDAEVTAYKNANIDALPEGLQNRRDRMARLDDEIRAQNREISNLEQELAVLREKRNPRAVEQRQIEALETQIASLIRARATLEGQRDQIAELNTRTPVIEGVLNTYVRRQQQLDEQLASSFVAGSRPKPPSA
jgi:tyrosine-protein kinase Etk/Wzc